MTEPIAPVPSSINRRRRLKTIAKRVLAVPFPIIPGIHHLLLAERKFRKGPLRHLISKIYYEPLLRMQCLQVGPGLILHEDMPKILRRPVIALGANVELSGAQVWIAAGDAPVKRIEIGDNTYVGHGTELIAGSSIFIGNNVRIANRVILNGYDGHPLDPILRAQGFGPPAEGRAAITVGDYSWVCNDVTILPGVRIGRGVVVASCSVVTRDVPDLALVAGNPARVVRQLAIPDGWV